MSTYLLDPQRGDGLAHLPARVSEVIQRAGGGQPTGAGVAPTLGDDGDRSKPLQD